MHLCTELNFFESVCLCVSFSCLAELARVSNRMWNRNAKNGFLDLLSHILGGLVFSLPSLSVDINYAFFS